MWIQTYKGHKFEFDELAPIDIEDIAHSLANTCRYNGHCKRFYSVAEHSVLVSQLVTNKLAGLLHDASEAYVGDLPYPLKLFFRSIGAYDFDDLEESLHRKIFEMHNLPWPMPKEVKRIDRRMLTVEAPALLGKLQPGWGIEHLDPLDIKLHFWEPEEAEKQFLEAYRSLT